LESGVGFQRKEKNGNTEQILDIKQPNNSLKSMSGGRTSWIPHNFTGNSGSNNKLRTTTEYGNIQKDPVPAPSLFGTSNQDNLNTVKEKNDLKSKTIFSGFYDIFGTNILKEKFITNSSLSMNFYLTSGFVIFFFIIMSALKLYFTKYTENYFIKNIISILIIVVSYVPLIILFEAISFSTTDIHFPLILIQLEFFSFDHMNAFFCIKSYIAFILLLLQTGTVLEL
jgi:hypothetical protein